jgi:biopolymer transport protein ExbD
MAINRERKPKKVEEMNLLPVMALFSILIPFLISVASFQKLGIVDVHLPTRSDVPDPESEPPPPDDQAINLTVALGKEEGGHQYVQIVARGGMLPMIYYKEMHTYRCKVDNDTITHDPAVLANSGKAPTCRNGNETDQYEIETIHAWTLQRESEEDPGKLLYGVYTKSDSAYVDGNNQFVSDKSLVKPGAALATLKESSTRKIDPLAANEAERRPLSAYDELARSLIGIHNRFIDAPDADKIIVLANDDVIFDKVIKVMDRAREAGFWQISLAKLGG